ncbi:threonine ammonia-lyase [Kiloniella laminariae]|uniref:threonine ammonia-lyase n=1 Tax=Kiloniella laminariae TaxID=454162 RepID=UPI000366B319|nr:threonine ammonia-lyase [Kiloniella laminariae]
MTVTIDEIRKAAGEIHGEVVRTPFVHAKRLSDILGCELYLKLESQQYSGSFKDRGALYRIKNLTPEQRKKGVIAMSAGNHAQGVALHAKRLGIPATIVMPETAPFSKIERTRALGAKVILSGETLDDSRKVVDEIVARDGTIFIHPYDDEFVIAGQGTIGLEMLEDQPDLDAIVVPIGGGGILSGISIASQSLKPGIKLYGVEANLFPSMSQALKHQPATSGGSTMADGIAVKEPGKLTREIIDQRVEEIFLVDESQIETAILTLVEEQKVVSEGAGATGVAAIIANAEKFKGMKIATVICGGNIDARMLSGLLMRGLMRDNRLVRIRTEMVDQPGLLAKISRIIGQTRGNIIDVMHQRHYYDVPAKMVEIDFIVETRDQEHVDEIITKLGDESIKTRILSSRSTD